LRTSEAVPGRGAGLGRRLGAMLYDGMLVLAIWMLTLFVLVAVTNSAVLGAAVQTLLFLEMYLFFAYFWLSRGQTLGMLAWGLELRTDDGTALTLRQVTLRFFGALASFACAGLGYLWILIDRQNRSWSDLVSGSHVIHRPRKRAA
jgi:uncharacterized RDD family membrane protein YckC